MSLPKIFLHKRPYPLPPTRRGPRNASNYPFLGVWYTDRTSPGVMAQEEAEFVIWTLVITIAPFVALISWWALAGYITALANPWTLARMEIESHALTLRIDCPRQNGLRDFAVLHDARIMARHYWFFRVIGWDAARVEQELWKAL